MADSSRRSFIKKSVVISTAASLHPVLKADAGIMAAGLKSDLKILFQGDSITDGNRTRDNDWNHIMGHGYAYIISSKLWYEHPERRFHFINRGISGNKVTDLAGRWQTDTLDIKPDILSILIGVNDTLASFNQKEAFTAESYENDYRKLLNDTASTLPDVKLIIGEPFILPVGPVKEKWDMWNNAVMQRQHIARKLSQEFNAVFVPYQKAFNDALKKAPAEYWIWDGIHPMPAGHELMAREWLKATKGIGLL